MRKVVFVFLTVAFLVGAGYLVYQEFNFAQGGGNNAVLSVNTPYADAGVFLDNEYIGPTPYFNDELEPGEKSLRVGEWVGKITLTSGALTAVNLDLGPGEFSGGDTIWLEKNKGQTSLAVISDPDGAVVKIDNVEVGETPLREEVKSGEHKVEIEKEGYVPREVRIRAQKDYKLNLSTELMPNPVPENIKEAEISVEKVEVKDFSSSNEFLTSDIEAWVKGLVFYFKSYGFESEHKPDYYLTGEGNLYNNKGELLAIEDYPQLSESTLAVGYLDSSPDDGLSQSALDTLSSLESGGEVLTSEEEQVEIVSTGTGWLRVRSGPGLGNEEVARVNVGERVLLLEESNGWYKIKLSDDSEGWISGQYARKLNE